MKDFALTGQRLESLNQAILDNFNRDDLERLLLFKLEKYIDQIVGSNDNITVVVFKIINESQKNGWLTDFVGAAHKARPSDPILARIHAELTEYVDLQASGAVSDLIASSSFQNSLPIRLDKFIGREAEKNTIRQLLSENRHVTLGGPGGIGKTSLALEVARAVSPEYANGVALVSLVELTNPELVPQQVAKVFQLKEDSDEPLATKLRNYLRSKQVLLILDNCEHVFRACAKLAHFLLSDCPRLKILATSRRRLFVAGEKYWKVSPLSLPDLPSNPSREGLLEAEAVSLFIERATTADHTFTPDDETLRLVAEICIRLDGLPLAIELAAARLGDLGTVQRIAQRLNSFFQIANKGHLGGMEHHETMAAAIDWSYRLLSLEEQSLLNRLAVFAGGWTLEAAEHICADDTIAVSEVENLLGSLQDKSLVQQDKEHGEARYKLLEVIRQYAQIQLDKSEIKSVIHSRHANEYMNLVELAEPQCSGPEQVKWLALLDKDYANMRAAITWSCGTSGQEEVGLRIAGGLSQFWIVRGYIGEGLKLLNELLSSGAHCASALRAKAMFAVGRLYSLQDSRNPQALEFFNKTLELYRTIGDRRGIAWSLHEISSLFRHTSDNEQRILYSQESMRLFEELNEKRGIGLAHLNLGVIERNRQNYEQAKLYIEKGKQLLEECGDMWGLAWSLNDLASTARHQGDYVSATAFLEQCLPVFRQLFDRRGILYTLMAQGDVARDQGNLALARSLYQQSQALSADLGDRNAMAWTNQNLGRIAHVQGDYSLARGCYEKSLELFRAIDHQAGIAAAYLNLGRLAHLAGDLPLAKTYFEKSIQLWRQHKNRRGIALVLDEFGHIARAQENFIEAISHYTASLEIFYNLREQRRVASSLEHLGSVLHKKSDFGAALLLLSAASALRDRISALPSPAARLANEQTIRELRAEVSEFTFAESWEQGQKMMLAEVIDYVRTKLIS